MTVSMKVRPNFFVTLHGPHKAVLEMGSRQQLHFGVLRPVLARA